MLKIWQTVHKIQIFFGRTESLCQTVIQNYELLGQVSDVKNIIHARRSKIGENIEAVTESVEEQTSLSIFHRSLEFHKHPYTRI